jgi:hypothetical protein
MKKCLFICGLIVVNLAIAAQAMEIGGDWTVNTLIPQGNPVGITESETLAGPNSSSISAVDVQLNISGGYNGGLYGYLEYQALGGGTATEVLLNQVGTSLSDPLGSSGAGFNVTLSDSGTVNGDIHDATGIPTGIWQPDSSVSLDSTFGGMSDDGTWTLFIADLDSGGGTSELNSWGLEVSVPDDMRTGWALGISGLLIMVVEKWIRSKRKTSLFLQSF